MLFVKDQEFLSQAVLKVITSSFYLSITVSFNPALFTHWKINVNYLADGIPFIPYFMLCHERKEVILEFQKLLQ